MSKWAWVLSFLLGLGFVFLTVFYFQQFKSYQLGLKLLKDKNYSSAKQEFLHILEQKPFLFPARLNLALVESLQENFKDAIGEYKVVTEDSSDKEERFQAHFNIAMLKFHSGDVDSSLEHYQKALKDNPESMEVKVNIEWMMLVQDQQNKQKRQEEQKEKENQESQEESKQSKNDIKQEKKDEEKIKETEKTMNEDQIEFIFKELEDREQKLRSRLQDKKGKRREGKSW